MSDKSNPFPVLPPAGASRAEVARFLRSNAANLEPLPETPPGDDLIGKTLSNGNVWLARSSVWRNGLTERQIAQRAHAQATTSLIDPSRTPTSQAQTASAAPGGPDSVCDHGSSSREERRRFGEALVAHFDAEPDPASFCKATGLDAERIEAWRADGEPCALPAHRVRKVLEAYGCASVAEFVDPEAQGIRLLRERDPHENDDALKKTFARLESGLGPVRFQNWQAKHDFQEPPCLADSPSPLLAQRFAAACGKANLAALVEDPEPTIKCGYLQIGNPPRHR